MFGDLFGAKSRRRARELEVKVNELLWANRDLRDKLVRAEGRILRLETVNHELQRSQRVAALRTPPSPGTTPKAEPRRAEARRLDPLHDDPAGMAILSSPPYPPGAQPYPQYVSSADVMPEPERFRGGGGTADGGGASGDWGSSSSSCSDSSSSSSSSDSSSSCSSSD